MESKTLDDHRQPPETQSIWPADADYAVWSHEYWMKTLLLKETLKELDEELKRKTTLIEKCSNM